MQQALIATAFRTPNPCGWIKSGAISTGRGEREMGRAKNIYSEYRSTIPIASVKPETLSSTSEHKSAVIMHGTVSRYPSRAPRPVP